MSGADVELAVVTDVEPDVVCLVDWEDDWVTSVGFEVDSSKENCSDDSFDVLFSDVDCWVDDTVSDVLDVIPCSVVDVLGLLPEVVSAAIVLDADCELVDNVDNVDNVDVDEVDDVDDVGDIDDVGDVNNVEGEELTGELASLFVDLIELVVCEVA